jgi:hypothetical protein
LSKDFINFWGWQPLMAIKVGPPLTIHPHHSKKQIIWLIKNYFFGINNIYLLLFSFSFFLLFLSKISRLLKKLNNNKNIHRQPLKTRWGWGLHKQGPTRRQIWTNKAKKLHWKPSHNLAKKRSTRKSWTPLKEKLWISLKTQGQLNG